MDKKKLGQLSCNQIFFNDLVIKTIEHYLCYQLPFTIIMETEDDLKNYLPVEAFTTAMTTASGKNIPILIIDIKNWPLEIAELTQSNCFLSTILVYGESTEYPIDLPIDLIMGIIDIESGISILNRYFPRYPDFKRDGVANYSNNSNNRNHPYKEKSERIKLTKQLVDEEGIKLSMSKLRLVKPGED